MTNAHAKTRAIAAAQLHNATPLSAAASPSPTSAAAGSATQNTKSNSTSAALVAATSNQLIALRLRQLQNHPVAIAGLDFRQLTVPLFDQHLCILDAAQLQQLRR